MLETSPAVNTYPAANCTFDTAPFKNCVVP
jgi:hypothetical protein